MTTNIRMDISNITPVELETAMNNFPEFIPLYVERIGNNVFLVGE